MEVTFTSRAEAFLARELRLALADIPIGAPITDSDQFRDALSSLEYFIPEVLGEIHTEWRHESLDGIFPEIATKTNTYEVEIAGLCIIISDQTLTPIHVRLLTAPDKDEIAWLECRLGESSPQGMVRIPYGSSRGKLAVASRLDTIDWVYFVGFGDRVSSKPQ